MKQKSTDKEKTSSSDDIRKYWTKVIAQRRLDIKVLGHRGGLSFLESQKQYEGYLPDDKF